MNNSQKFMCCGNNCEECNGDGIVSYGMVIMECGIGCEQFGPCDECDGTGLGPNIIENLLLDAEDSILIYEICPKCKNN